MNMGRVGKHNQEQDESNKGDAQIEGGIGHVFDDEAHVAETLHDVVTLLLRRGQLGDAAMAALGQHTRK